MPSADTTLHDEGDNDSLFGSPPPSPGRGRSPSPLALPSGPSSVQNVGTLALPGSHIFNELPSVSASVSTITCDPNIATAQPSSQAQPQFFQPSSPVYQPAAGSLSCVSLSGRSSTPVAAPRAARASRKSIRKAPNRSEPSSNSSTPRPTPPPISLPNPSEPPPSNFLRNQQALLGLAGMVSGVNPANLALPRGSSANNPIVVGDDENESPTIGRRPPQSYYPMVAYPPVYPASIPVPSSDDIVQTLIKQKNIFPVVGALLSLVSRTSEGQSIWSQYQMPSSGFHRPYVNGPDAVHPSKRRKVDNVPAGAGDWDVPYPFPVGQGPTNYRTNWERQRGKQLIEDLITLVKSAARKAAAKNYYKMQQQPQIVPPAMQADAGKVFRHYRPETLKYGLEPGQASPTLSSVEQATSGSSATAGSSIPVPSSSSTNPIVDFSPTPTIPPVGIAPSIDELLAAMMSAPQRPPASVPHQDAGSDPSCPSTFAAATELHYTPSSSSTTAQASSNDVGPDFQSNISDFLAMIDNLPQGELSELFSPPSEDGPTPPMSRASTIETNVSQHADFQPPFVPDSEPGQIGSAPIIDPSVYAADPSLLAIDPTLLALSYPSFMSGAQTQTQAETRRSVSTGPPPTPTLVGSPLSLDHDEPDPVTPSWECVFPDPDVASGVEGNDVVMGSTDEVGVSVGVGGGDGRDGHEEHSLGGISKGKGKEREVSMDMQSPCNDLSASVDIEGGVVMHDADESAPLRANLEVSSRLPSSSQFTFRVQPQPHTDHSRLPPNPPPQPSLPPTQSYPYPLVASSSASTSTDVSTPPPLPFPLSIAIPILQASQTKQGSSSQSQQKKNKQEILQRARTMRAQLVTEIERAKVELWETAMEGGCLVVLGKEFTKSANASEKGKEREVA